MMRTSIRHAGRGFVVAIVVEYKQNNTLFFASMLKCLDAKTEIEKLIQRSHGLVSTPTIRNGRTPS